MLKHVKGSEWYLAHSECSLSKHQLLLLLSSSLSFSMTTWKIYVTCILSFLSSLGSLSPINSYSTLPQQPSSIATPRSYNHQNFSTNKNLNANIPSPDDYFRSSRTHIYLCRQCLPPMMETSDCQTPLSYLSAPRTSICLFL